MEANRHQQASIDDANKAFWEELCGTGLARALGITDASPASLARFDAWYFDYYPYLLDHVPVAQMSGRRVLEMGLGYGSLGQKIAEAGAAYFGLDIAAGPVAMARHRLAQVGRPGFVTQASALACPFGDDTFDWVVAIGCLHHTGDIRRALAEVHRVLRPGGSAVVMVYNALSYRQWAAMPAATLRRVLSVPARSLGHHRGAAAFRGTYDLRSDGTPAPHTDFLSRREFRYLARDFKACRVVRENIGAGGWLRFLPRRTLCRALGPTLGLDLYCRLDKAERRTERNTDG